MRTYSRVFAAAMTVAGLMLVGAARADDPAESTYEKNAKLGGPGPEHENLKGFLGKWELSQEGVKEKGFAEIKSIYGGRFLTEDASIPFGPGRKMEWHGIYGYDRFKKRYTAVWVDNLDTTTESGVGEADSTGRIITYKGEHHDPRTGALSKFVWRISHDGKDAMAIEMCDVDKNGKEGPAWKIVGKKVK